MKKAASWILIAIAFTPFFWFPYVLGEFNTPKTIFLRGAAFFVILFVSLILAYTTKDRDALYNKIGTLYKSPLFLALSANITLLAVSTVFAFDRSIAFFGELQRTEGFLTLFALYAVYIGFWLFFEEKQWKQFWLITAAAPVILCIVQIAHLTQGIARPDAFTGNPSFLAGYYLFAIFAAFQTLREGVLFSKQGYLWMGASGLVASLFGVMLTGTRGATLGVTFAFFVVALVMAVSGGEGTLGRLSIRKVGIVVCSALIALGLILGITRHASVWNHIPGVNRVVETTTTDSNTNSRVLFAQESLHYFWSDGGAKRVLLGWGWDNYVFFWTRHYDPKTFYYDPSIADRAHDKLIDELVMTGVLGLLSYLAVWFFFMKRVVTIIRHDCVRALPFIFVAVAYMTFLLVTFDMPMILVYFYAVLAFVDTIYLKTI